MLKRAPIALVILLTCISGSLLAQNFQVGEIKRGTPCDSQWVPSGGGGVLSGSRCAATAGFVIARSQKIVNGALVIVEVVKDHKYDAGTRAFACPSLSIPTYHRTQISATPHDAAMNAQRAAGSYRHLRRRPPRHTMTASFSRTCVRLC